MVKFDKFIPQNKAPVNSDAIYLYRGNSVIGKIKTSSLTLNSIGEKRYSFGAVSDVHIVYNTAKDDFKRALTFFNSEGVAFICVCGDLTSSGLRSELQTYADHVNTYSPYTPVYEITGNHDCPNTLLPFDGIREFTGHPLYYSFEYKDDVFIMFGMQFWSMGSNNQDPFSNVALQWLYNTLESNRNKRCFVFQHCLRFDGSGKPYAPNMTVDLLDNQKGRVFKSLMEHYKNVIWFHGHSHMQLKCQVDSSYANYDRMFGCHSVHIPSLAVPRSLVNGEYVYLYSESEGYMVDVYDNCIVLKGRDFVKGLWLPIATYCIDTKLIPIIEKSYSDSTGTISI